MNTLAQKPIIKRPTLNVVSAKNTAILPIKQNAATVKKITMHGLQLIMHFSLYFPITFIWLTVAFALSGHFSMTYPFEPEAVVLTFDKVAELLSPVFRLSLAITLMLSFLRLAIGVFQKKSNKKDSI